jgi:hypothetical protein
MPVRALMWIDTTCKNGIASATLGQQLMARLRSVALFLLAAHSLLPANRAATTLDRIFQLA